MQTTIITPEDLRLILSDKFQKIFWSKISIAGEDECWNWIRCLNSGGYGNLGFKKSVVSAHRIAWIIKNKKPVPDGLGVLHSCKANRACCNPNHLRPGNQLQNVDDARKQGRLLKARGEGHGNHKLTDADIPKIRELYATGEYKLSEVGKMFGVHLSSIWMVIHKKYWKHVGG